MSRRRLLSIIESPTHPNFSALYQRLGIDEVRVSSIRKAVSQAKKLAPDLVIAEFFYGYANNYAGANVSNLDVFLASLQKYAPQARVILMVNKSERDYVSQLGDRFPLHAVLQQPVGEQQIEPLLRE